MGKEGILEIYLHWMHISSILLQFPAGDISGAAKRTLRASLVTNFLKFGSGVVDRTS